MPNLNDRNWKEFKISDLFDVLGTTTTKPELLIDNGKIPRITCAATNNGLDRFVSNKATERAPAITIDSATVGYVAYQGYDFIATDHVEKLYLKKNRLNLFIGLFIKQVIDKSTNGKYNYGYKFSQSRIKMQTILLPITTEGNPDYEFMEQYIRQIINHKHAEYRSFLNKQTNIKALPSKKWKEFNLIQLVDIYLSKGDNQAKFLRQGTIPLVSAGTANNGICKYILSGDGISNIFKGNSVTIDMFGKGFYQPASFYAVSHGRVNIMIPKFDFNKWLGLFIVTAFEHGNIGKYSFANMCNQTRLQRTKIMLPVDDNDAPDYEYMAQYIKNKMYEKYSKYLDFIAV